MTGGVPMRQRAKSRSIAGNFRRTTISLNRNCDEGSSGVDT